MSRICEKCREFGVIIGKDICISCVRKFSLMSSQDYLFEYVCEECQYLFSNDPGICPQCRSKKIVPLDMWDIEDSCGCDSIFECQRCNMVWPDENKTQCPGCLGKNRVKRQCSCEKDDGGCGGKGGGCGGCHH